MSRTAFLEPTDSFPDRHIGPDAEEQRRMLATVGYGSLDELTDAVVPADIRLGRELELPAAVGEHEMLSELRSIAGRNELFRSFLGLGYHECVVPAVIRRNILENPGWYTQYTPYQAEIAQGRLEALLNFQTMIADLTGLPLANASLLDEATAAAEALAMCRALARGRREVFFVSEGCHPQTIEVLRTRAWPIGVRLEVGSPTPEALREVEPFGLLLQLPDTRGQLADPAAAIAAARGIGAHVVVACDLLSLALVRPPGELGADIAVGSSQRFGVPLGYGGPHAAFLAARDEFRRVIPGRVVGVSKDDAGRPALRLALQTREQHIRREKATSNICTAQVLLAIMAGMYAVYHGPEGLRRIARRVRGLALTLAAGLTRLGCKVVAGSIFDTVAIELGTSAAREVLAEARRRRINLRDLGDGTLTVTLDEPTTLAEVRTLLEIFARGRTVPPVEELAASVETELPAPLARSSEFLTHDVFRRYHSEHELLRYISRLQARDLSLTQSMIPLGSCTMKLNAAAELLPITWPELGALHPFAPVEQARGYAELFGQLERAIGEITGLEAVSLQPNSGAQGEYTGLLVIRAYHESRGDGARDVCLIPASAHGTNPASAALAGYRVVVVACDAAGNIDLGDLAAKLAAHAGKVAAIMITYPSTHGVFEAGVREACAAVHAAGAQVYLDGANMNAQVGLCRPLEIGADVCHLNLHKTFCIPHGGGGPGMGPIAVARHLAPFLPGHALVPGVGGERAIGAVSAAPWGSAGILCISWAYIRMMGATGLTRATQVAILNANYMARRLAEHYAVLFSGPRGLVAHEFILDTRPFKDSAGITVDDIAKRLMDYGFHAPTMSFPVAGTLMIEPTESESKDELDRFCDAMVRIREEIRAIEDGRMDAEHSPLRRAPHTARAVLAESWDRPYTREQGAFPAPWLAEHKFWPAVGRIDNAWGDRNLVCTCEPIESYEAG